MGSRRDQLGTPPESSRTYSAYQFVLTFPHNASIKGRICRWLEKASSVTMWEANGYRSRGFPLCVRNIEGDRRDITVPTSNTVVADIARSSQSRSSSPCSTCLACLQMKVGEFARSLTETPSLEIRECKASGDLEFEIARKRMTICMWKTRICSGCMVNNVQSSTLALP